MLRFVEGHGVLVKVYQMLSQMGCKSTVGHEILWKVRRYLESFSNVVTVGQKVCCILKVFQFHQASPDCQELPLVAPDSLQEETVLCKAFYQEKISRFTKQIKPSKQ
jgi:hypothetical protein